MLRIPSVLKLVRISIATAALGLSAVSQASAQTDDARLAVGANLSMRAATSDNAAGANEVGLLCRFNHKHSGGWGVAFGLNWYSTDIQQPVGGFATELGELHVRPIMAGVGYTRVLGRRTSLEASLLGGYALTSFHLAPAATDAFRDRLGEREVGARVSRTFAVKPEIGVWYDISRKVGLNVSAGYMLARPTLTLSTSSGQDEQHFRADMFILRVGAVYKIF